MQEIITNDCLGLEEEKVTDMRKLLGAKYTVQINL
jgi:hypothetical protein